MEQENRMMFARCHNLKRKCRGYVKSKVPASPDSSDEEEAPESQMKTNTDFDNYVRYVIMPKEVK